MSLEYIICLVIGILVAGVPLGLKLRQRVKINEEIQLLNEKEEQKYNSLLERQASLDAEYQKARNQYDEVIKLAESNANAVADAALTKAMAGVEESLTKAMSGMEESLDALGRKYQEAEQEYNEEYTLVMKDLVSDLIQQTENQQKKIAELEKKRNELAASVEASIKARLREKEIKEQLDFYRVKLDELDLADIETLTKIKKKLNKPRILSMLIWQTYYQKPMTQLCNNILGEKVVTGIYKITNQETGQVYIGQARNMAERFKEHAKCGLDIDRPAANKLYQAMVEDGLYNFSFELLEECDASELNDKERHFIELYKSAEFGYNSNKGVGKK